MKIELTEKEVKATLEILALGYYIGWRRRLLARKT